MVADNKKAIFKYISSISIVILVTLITTITLHEPTNNRFKTTLGLFSNDYEIIDKATAWRLPLWETATNAFIANPVNGIGPRGFRFVYQDYAPANDYWETQTHPHLLTLEILAETGLIGLLGYITFIYIILHGFFKRRAFAKEFPFLIPVIVALFPLNAHMAFYGSIWSSMSWWLIAIYFSSIRLKIHENTNY